VAKLDFRPLEVQGLEIISAYLAAVGATYTFNRQFRGHANSKWLPIASAFRPGVNGIVRKDQLRFWRSMAQRFVSPQPTSELAYLVLAQHYGIPTGLLDWTSNPLVALFFACQPLDENQHGEVVQIDTTDLHRIESIETVEVFKQDREKPLLLDTSAMNVRSTAQDSFMTLHVAYEPPLAVTPVYMIAADEKSKVRNALHLFGLSEERIYADLTVAAVSFKMKLKCAN
jgi:hypothetical protein